MKKIKISLPIQILIALALGVIFGVFFHEYVKYISWAGDIFIRLLKMIVRTADYQSGSCKGHSYH